MKKMRQQDLNLKPAQIEPAQEDSPPPNLDLRGRNNNLFAEMRQVVLSQSVVPPDGMSNEEFVEFRRKTYKDVFDSERRRWGSR